MAKSFTPPTISLQPLKTPGLTPEKLETVEKIKSAAIEWGFFNVVDHGVADEVIDRFWSQMDFFFHEIPEDVKRDCMRDEKNVYGYFETEFTKNRLDWKKGWDFSLGGEVDGYPRWPEGYEAFKDATLEYYHEMSELGKLILKGIALALQREEDYLEEMFESHTSLLRLNYYPVFEGEDLDPDTLGVGPHTDISGITILKQDDSVTSLQAYLGEGDGLQRYDDEWHDVPPVPGAFTINVGDLSQVWSNGIFNAGKHRVLTNVKERLSAPFFYFPNYEAIIEPLDVSLTPKYSPFNFGDFRMSRFAGDYADVGEEIQITKYLFPEMQ